MTTPAHDLQPGGRYLIELMDCCVEAELVGQFSGYADTDSDDEFRPLVFDIGTFTGWGQVRFTEIGEGP